MGLFLATFPLQAKEDFKEVIRWDMEKLNESGEIPNEIREGPYADATLVLKGAKLIEDEERGMVLFFEGVDDWAECTSPWRGHKGVRVTAWVKNLAPSGQSVLLSGGPFRLWKMAGSARFSFASEQMPDWRENWLGVHGLAPEVWRQVTAQFDPGLRKATIECGEHYAEMDCPKGDGLAYSYQPFVMGTPLNGHFEGCIDEVVVEVKD
jgi:hypothetical protein